MASNTANSNGVQVLPLQDYLHEKFFSIFRINCNKKVKAILYLSETFF